MAKLLEKLRDFRRPKQIDLEDYILKLKARGLDNDGKLVPDPVPIAPPIGYKKAPSMVEIVRDMVKGERLAQAAREAGAETFEEAEDFDVPDDPPDMRSPFENTFDPPISELLSAGQQALAEKAGEAAKAAGSPDKPAPPPPAPPAPKAE